MKSFPWDQIEVSVNLQDKTGKGKRSQEAAPAQGTSFTIFYTSVPTPELHLSVWEVSSLLSPSHFIMKNEENTKL